MRSKNILWVFLPLTIIVLTSSCRGNKEDFTNHLSANALKGGGIAYSRLEDLLGKSVTDNDFTKFANNPNNYEVIIKEDSSSFTYVFLLNPYQGRPVLDGSITFKVNKKDWRAMQTVKP